MFILTEKSSVATSIAMALGGFKKCDGYWTNGQDCITSAQGHLLQLYSPQDYDSQLKKWSIDTLPIVPQKFLYQPIPDNFKILSRIKDCFSKYDSSDFVLATDAEREGELIGALILNYVHFQNYNSAKRFWVSEALTTDVVKKGLASAKPLSDYTSYKNEGYARQQADWLVGINITRLLSCSSQVLLSFGRVQTAVLGAIYLREKSIANFIPSPYFQLQISVKPQTDSSEFTMLLSLNNSDRFTLQDDYLKSASVSVTKGSTLNIISINKETKIEQTPQLFNITGLQKSCSVKYKLSPKETLEIAQSLYDEPMKCLSYPRTPSVVLGDDNIDLYKTVFITLSEKYSKEAVGCNTEYITQSNKRLFNSSELTDHHALIPLAPLPQGASIKQECVYYEVLQRFFKTIQEPHIFEAISVTAAKESIQFIAHGKNVIQQGWRSTNVEDDSELQKLPEMKEGQLLDVCNQTILKKQTKPKKHFTNASILSLMENPKLENISSGKLIGLGTPATRAEIIDTLIKREYIIQEKQNLLITEKGKFLINTIIKIPSLADFISLKTTTAWEEKLRNNPDKFLSEITDFLQKEIPKISITEKFEKQSLGICPICKKGNIKENQKSYYCSEYKNGCSFTVWKKIAGANVSLSDIQLLLTRKQTRMKKMQSKAGKQFCASLILNDKGEIEFKFKD